MAIDTDDQLDTETTDLDEGAPADDAPEQDAAPADDGDHAPPTPDTDDGEPRQTRAQRKADRGRIYRENQELKAEMARLREAVQTMAGSTQKQTDTMDRVVESFKKQAPAEKSELETLQERIDQVLPTVGKVPGAYEAYKKLDLEYKRAIAREVAQEESEKVRASMPRQLSPEQLEYRQLFPWMDDDDETIAASAAAVKRLAAAQKRNMSDPKVRRTTVIEALTKLAPALGYEAPKRTPAATGGQRFASPGGRSGGGNPGDPAGIQTTEQMTKIAKNLGISVDALKKRYAEELQRGGR